MSSWSRSHAQHTWSLILGVLLCALSSGCGGKNVAETPVTLSPELVGVIRGGRGSGVVGAPISQVKVYARLGDRQTNAVMTDPSGGFTLNVIELFPPGTDPSPDALRTVKPVVVDLYFEREGYKTLVETMSFPVNRLEEFPFMMSGLGD